MALSAVVPNAGAAQLLYLFTVRNIRSQELMAQHPAQQRRQEGSSRL